MVHLTPMAAVCQPRTLPKLSQYKKGALANMQKIAARTKPAAVSSRVAPPQQYVAQNHLWLLQAMQAMQASLDPKHPMHSMIAAPGHYNLRLHVAVESQQCGMRNLRFGQRLRHSGR